MNILITGITGFVGSHMVDYLMADQPDAQIWGSRRYRSSMQNYTKEREQAVHWVEGVDLTDLTSARRLVEMSLPDRIFHLSANSFVPESYTNPNSVLYNNIVGQQNLFEALRQTFGKHHKVRVQVAGSSEEYGLVGVMETPINEDNKLRPMSPYGVSKVAQDLGGYQEWQTYGTYVVRTRGFNHTGARRGEAFVCSNFAKQIAEIESHERVPIIKVGNLDAVRDFTDVRDMVRGYWMALESGQPGDVYNIGSGTSWTIQQILDGLIGMSHSTNINIVNDPIRMRPSDVPILEADASKFNRMTGWTPQTPVYETLEWILNYWRGIV